MYVLAGPKAESGKSQFVICWSLCPVNLVQQSSLEAQLIGTPAYPSKFPVISETIDFLVP